MVFFRTRLGKILLWQKFLKRESLNLRLSMLTIFNIDDVNGVVVVSLFNCERISNFVLIIDFENVNACLVYIEKAINFEDKIGYIMHYVVLYHQNPTGESVRNFCEGVWFRCSFRLKMTCCMYICLFTDFAF